MTVDNVTGLVGTAVTAAVGLGVVKMTTDMISDMAGKCKKCGKVKQKCKCKKSDYGGELFKVDNWTKL